MSYTKYSGSERVAASQPNNQQAVRGTNDRKLGDVTLRTYERKLDIDEIDPNPKQPRSGAKIDPSLQLQIEANGGIFEPLLVEIHPDKPDKYRIVDGERRWTNCAELVANGKKQYRTVPAEIIDRTPTDDERLRVWVHRHRQRKEWSARDKENVANQLVKHLGKAVAADILGISTREVDKLVNTYTLSTRFKELPDESAAITWARELQGIAKKLVTPEVIDAVVDKVQRRRITNSKELRELRKILRDPVATDNFLSTEGDVRSALLCIRPIGDGKSGKEENLVADLDAFINALGRHPWRSIDKLRQDPAFLERIEQAQRMLNDLKHMADQAKIARESKER